MKLFLNWSVKRAFHKAGLVLFTVWNLNTNISVDFFFNVIMAPLGENSCRHNILCQNFQWITSLWRPTVPPSETKLIQINMQEWALRFLCRLVISWQRAAVTQEKRITCDFSNPKILYYKKTKIASLQKRTEHHLISTMFRSKTHWTYFSIVLGFFLSHAADSFWCSFCGRLWLCLVATSEMNKT